MDPVQPYLEKLLTDWRIWGLVALLVLAALFFDAKMSIWSFIYDWLQDRYHWLIALALFAVVMIVFAVVGIPVWPRLR